MRIKQVLPIKGIAGRLRDVLFRRDDAVLRELLPKTADEELVHVIDSLPPEEKLRVFRALPLERQLAVVLESSDYSIDTVLSGLTFEEIWRLIGAAESDDAVDVIQWIDDALRARVITALRKDDPKGLLPLLVFEEHTAGGRMKTEILRCRSGETADEVRKRLLKEPLTRYKTHYIYVTGANDVLLGRLSPIRLMQMDGKTRIDQGMNPDVVAVPAHMDQEDVALVFDEHGAIEVPVVGNKGRLLGVITADDIFEVMEQEHGEDFARMAGLDDEAHISDPVWLSARRRMPWLGVNLLTAIVAASVVGMFQDTIGRTVVLAAFMPVVAGMGGNAAQQALAVTVRAIALGDLRHLSTVKVVAKEVLVGALNGFLAGVVVGVIASLYTGDPMLGIIIVVAMTANLFIAGLVGVAVPVTMKALKADPALASTVFVTASTDVFGFFAFLGLASLLL